MLYTKNDVLNYVASEDVKFIRLAFCDVFGVQKNISVMPSELERAFEHGVPFDASAVSGFGSVEKSDLILRPDPSTLTVLPWRSAHGKVVRLFCGIEYPDGTAFEMDNRVILKKAIQALRRKGIQCSIGSEFEFYLFMTNENGKSTRIPHDDASYMDIAPEDKGENIRREICLTLEEMGIHPERSHHEVGPGQHEIDFRHSDPMTAADNAVTFKSVVRTVASRNGLCASFEPKPLPKEPGNGLHIHISLSSVEEKDFSMAFMAGVLRRIREITAFLNPSNDSYLRFGKDKAPRYVSWSEGNRSQLIRMPQSDFEGRRIELRSPDASLNPYLAYSLLIFAGLEGIEENLQPTEPTDINLHCADLQTASTYSRLPDSYESAIRIAQESDFVQKVIPEKTLSAYMELHGF